MCTIDEYRCHLEEAGFEMIQIDQVQEHVFKVFVPLGSWNRIVGFTWCLLLHRALRTSWGSITLDFVLSQSGRGFYFSPCTMFSFLLFSRSSRFFSSRLSLLSWTFLLAAAAIMEAVAESGAIAFIIVSAEKLHWTECPGSSDGSGSRVRGFESSRGVEGSRVEVMGWGLVLG